MAAKRKTKPLDEFKEDLHAYLIGLREAGEIGPYEIDVSRGLTPYAYDGERVVAMKWSGPPRITVTFTKL